MLRAFKYRLYPNVPQQVDIRKNIDACRFIYNWALDKSTVAYKTDNTSLSAYDIHAMLPELKQEHPFLKDAYSQSIQQSVRRMHKARQHFFRRVKQGDEKPGMSKFRATVQRTEKKQGSDTGNATRRLLTRDATFNKNSLRNWYARTKVS